MLNVSWGKGLCRHGYQGFGLEELQQGQDVGCSEIASIVPNAATPTRTTAKGPSVFLFINLYRIKRDTAGILEKFNLASTGSVTFYMSCQGVCRTTFPNNLLSHSILSN